MNRTVYTLICSRDLSLARATLGSFQRCSAEPVNFVFHEDGTLTPADVEALQAALPGASVIGQEQADDEIYPRLEGYRHCQAFRRASVYARKLFDIPLIPKPEIFYSDLDILFFRKCGGLFAWPDDVTEGMFMRDIESYYSVSSRLVFRGTLRIIQSLNAGFYHIRSGFMDLDLVNWFLGRDEFRTLAGAGGGMIEQTCWAVLAARKRIRFWDPSQVAVVDPRGFGKMRRHLIIGHFSGPSRPLLARAIEEHDCYLDRNDRNADAENLRYVKAKMFTPLAVLGYQIKKKCGLLPHQHL